MQCLWYNTLATAVWSHISSYPNPASAYLVSLGYDAAVPFSMNERMNDVFNMAAFCCLHASSRNRSLFFCSLCWRFIFQCCSDLGGRSLKWSDSVARRFSSAPRRLARWLLSVYGCALSLIYTIGGHWRWQCLFTAVHMLVPNAPIR